MDVTPLIPEGLQVIQGYADGHFLVAQTVYDGPVLVMPTRTVVWSIDLRDTGTFPADFSLDSLGEAFASTEPFDILLIGSGERQAFLKPAIRAAIRERGPVVEVMDTGAACRTYNLLLAEGRQVAAALIPLPSTNAAMERTGG